MIEVSAVELVDRLRRGEIAPHDCLDALEARIAIVEPRVNALPTRCFARARAHADALMRKPAAERGVLCGLPVAIKDLTDVAGVRTTLGSKIYADRVPDTSDVVVERLEAAGAIVYAKSNTPEFGAGAQTFNDVFGTTLNPHDTTKSAAGSSGGAAAALASGSAWVAHGSDMGGSLRNPASFCGIVGMRPTPGRVAVTRRASLDDTLGANGPMARTVEDVALMFDAMVGQDPRDPLSKGAPSSSFLAGAQARFRPRRVAFSADLGITPVDPEVAAITRAAAGRLADAGIPVDEAHPDLREAHDCFDVLRGINYVVGFAALLENHRAALKPDVVWNIEYGLGLTMTDIARAEQQRAAMLARAAAFFARYDLLLCPATIVPPFASSARTVEACAGVTFSNYYRWLAIAYAITLIGSPALSLPCGFTAGGLPVGLQIVAPAHGEAQLLGAARFLEEILGLDTLRPVTPTPR